MMSAGKVPVTSGAISSRTEIVWLVVAEASLRHSRPYHVVTV